MIEPRLEPSAEEDLLRRWRWMGLAAAALVALSVPLYLARRPAGGPVIAARSTAEAAFVGRPRCAECHRQQEERWRGSDHDRAMEVASEESVLGDFDDAVVEHRGVTSRFYRRQGRFFVHTEGPGGEMGEFEITHTFGHDPLQQYLIPFPGGRLQALSLAWDVAGRRWFHLYPDRRIPAEDWLHWTRNGQSWNGMCAECHSTHLEKGFDPENGTYETTWSEIDVSCEACHGPGSRHVAWAEIDPMARLELSDAGLPVATRDLDARSLVELCAPCHSRRSEMGDYDHRAAELMDTLVPARLEEGLYHPDGQILDEVYVYGSFLQSKMYRNGVRCSDCHDVHSLQLHREGNQLCLQCHRAADYDRFEHHFHRPVFEGRASEGVLCVRCHMPEQPYMVIDQRADHSLRVPRPDLSVEIGVPNACASPGCHPDRPLSWLADAYRRDYGRARKPHFGPTIAAGRAGLPKAEGELVRLAEDPLVAAIVRATAVELLGGYDSEASRSAVRRGLADTDPLVRFTAARGLVANAPEELVALLSPLLFDPVRVVRLQVSSRLAGLPEALWKPYQRQAQEATLAEYQAAMRRSLDFAFAGHNLGNLFRQLGDPERAESAYRRAIEVDELFFPAKINLAMLLNSQGRNEEASRLLREVVEAYPERPEAAFSLALLLAEMDRFEEAAKQLRAVLRSSPEDSRALFNLGLVAQRLGRSEEAESSLLRAVELAPENLRYLHALADLYLRSGEPARASTVAARMLALAPGDELARQLWALTQAALAQPGGG